MKIRGVLVYQVLLFASILAPIPVFAQDSPPLLHSTSRLVLLDVVVTDKTGHSIQGLSKDNFTILENGVPQKPTSFEPISSSFSGSEIKADAPHTIILLDELNITFEDLSYARDRILLFLDRNPAERQPTALMAIGPHGLMMLEDFTRDSQSLKDKLVHLKPYNPNPKGPGIDARWVREHAQSALQALTQIARAAVGSPHSLNVIWITSGFPGVVYTPDSNDEVDTGLRRVTNLLMRSRMRLYTIDPTGVIPLGEMAGQAKVTRGRIQDGHDSAAKHLLSSSGGQEVGSRVLLTHVTSMMGGLSYYGRNDIETAIDQAILDGSSEYMISYSPSDTNFDGKYRKIEVRIDVNGATARTRQGYYAVADDAVLDRGMTDALLDAAMSNPLIYAGLKVSCPANYDVSTNRLTGKLVITPRQPAGGTDQRDQIIRVASFSQDKKLLNNWIWRVSWKNAWTNREVSASFDKTLSPKAATVRFLVSDPTAQRIGTCEYQIQSSTKR